MLLFCLLLYCLSFFLVHLFLFHCRFQTCQSPQLPEPIPWKKFLSLSINSYCFCYSEEPWQIYQVRSADLENTLVFRGDLRFFWGEGGSLHFCTYNSGTRHVPLGFSWACEWGLNWSNHPLNASRVSSTGPKAPSFAVLHVLKPQPLSLGVNISLDRWASAKVVTLTRSSLFFPLASRILTLLLWVKLYLF